MAFVSWGPPANARGDGWRIGGTEVRDVVERVVRAVWSAVEGVDLPPRFAVLRYAEAMARVRRLPPTSQSLLIYVNLSIASHLIARVIGRPIAPSILASAPLHPCRRGFFSCLQFGSDKPDTRFALEVSPGRTSL